MLTIPDHVSSVVFAVLGMIMAAHAIHYARYRMKCGIMESKGKDLTHIVCSFVGSGILFCLSVLLYLLKKPSQGGLQ